MRQPDVDPHGLSDAPGRRRRRRLPYIVVGVALAALILFVWLHDRQPAQWENEQYGISLEFQNRFRNEGSDDLGPPAPGTVFRNGWLVRGNPGWDEEEWEEVAYIGLPLYFNGFVVSVVEPPAELRGVPANEITLGDDWPPAAAVASAGPVPATVGGRPALRYSIDLEHGGELWRRETWLVPAADLWYEVLLQARVSDWEEESPALTEAARSLRIAEGAGD
ncbi:MAG TPA: hypothetical protein VLA35_07925 [Thermoleophilia bacterium]|nr:hypothetical protein [Thermoleophilia bacterium]